MSNDGGRGSGGLLIGALTSGALGVGKAIIGGIQSIRGRKEMKNLLANRPQYNIPEAYQKALGIAQQRAAGEMPGMGLYEQQIAESTARSYTAAERGAISSNVYQGSVLSAQDRELQALQNLALMGANYKTQASQQLEAAQNRMGQLQDQAWNYNVAQPWDIKANMAQDRIQAGGQNLYGGMDEMSQTVQNFVGTKYMQEIYKSLYNK